MIKIAICDDETVFINNLLGVLNKFQEEMNYEIIIRSYENPFKLLDEIEFFDLLLLDVEMPEIDGFSVAKEIRKRGGDCEIVFLTSAREMGYRGFQVKAKNYLIKPIKYSVLKEIIIEEIESIKKKRQEQVVFSVTTTKLKKVNFSEIIYIESVANKCVVQCENEVFDVLDKLKEIKGRLKKYPIVNPHRSYLINNWKVKDYNSKETIMKDGSRIPISRLKYKDFREQYFEFLSCMKG